MQGSGIRFELPPGGRRPGGWLGFVLGLIGFAVAMTLGVVFFVFFLGAALLIGLVVYARIWWLGRKLRASGSQRHQPQAERRQAGASDTVIEGEYRVLDSRSKTGSQGENNS